MGNVKWNRPTTEGLHNKRGEKASQKARAWIILAIIAVVVGVIVVFAFLHSQDHSGQPAESEGVTLPLPDKKPNIVPREVVTNDIPKSAPLPFTKGMNGKVERDENGKRWFNGAPVPSVKPGDRFVKGKKVNRSKIFKFRSESMIAAKLLAQSGLGSSAVIRDFQRLEDDYKESLKHPIVINPEDDEKTKEAKQMMIEAKEIINARMAAGETFRDIYRELSETVRKVSSLRNELQRMKRELVKNGASDQEIADYVEASNRLLREQGAKEVVLPSAIRNRLESTSGESSDK